MPSYSFYNNVIPLNSKNHQALRVKAPTDFRFACKTQSVTIGTGEFFECAIEYPIVFVSTAQGHVPVALLGLRPEENLFIDENGKWDAGYLPAFVRRYPFVMMAESEQRFAIGFDADYEGMQEKEGERLLNDEGQPSEYLQTVLKSFEHGHTEFQRGALLGKSLSEKGLLQTMSAQMSFNGNEKIELGGFQVVDAAKVEALSEEDQGKMAKTGELALIYSHLVSIRNFRKLLARVEKYKKAAEQKATNN